MHTPLRKCCAIAMSGAHLRSRSTGHCTGAAEVRRSSWKSLQNCCAAWKSEFSGILHSPTLPQGKQLGCLGLAVRTQICVGLCITFVKPKRLEHVRVCVWSPGVFVHASSSLRVHQKNLTCLAPVPVLCRGKRSRPKVLWKYSVVRRVAGSLPQCPTKARQAIAASCSKIFVSRTKVGFASLLKSTTHTCFRMLSRPGQQSSMSQNGLGCAHAVHT